jgi:hypothetical protein
MKQNVEETGNTEKPRTESIPMQLRQRNKKNEMKITERGKEDEHEKKHL